MDFYLDEVQKTLIAQIDEICAENCDSASEVERDQTGAFPQALFDALAQSGILEHGREMADGRGFLTACLIAEALAYRSGTASSLFFVNSIARATLFRNATPLPSDLAAKLEAGTANLAFGMTEPGAGSDAGSIATYAERVGDEYVINGAKHYTTGSYEADYILLVTRTTKDGPAKSGTSIILVPGDAEGLIKTKIDKMSGNSHASCDLTLKNVRVPAENLVGQEHAAWRQLFFSGIVERMMVAGTSLGIAQRAFDHVKTFLQNRVQFGQPVSGFQTVQHQLVDMATQLEAMRWMAYHAGWKFDAEGDAAKEINMAKIFCSETGHAIATQAFRLAGAESFIQSDLLNRSVRELFVGFFAGGTGEIHRNSVARSLGV